MIVNGKEIITMTEVSEVHKITGRRIPVYTACGIAVGMFVWALIMSTLGAMGMLEDPTFAQPVIYGAGAGMVICIVLAMVATMIGEEVW